MKKLFDTLVALFFLVGIVFPTMVQAQPEILKIDVCHATGSETNPYVLVNVSINSVEDAQSVGGHGSHEDDAWSSYIYAGVTYPGRGNMDNCSGQTPATATFTPTNTSVPTATFTSTPTDEPKATATSTPEGQGTATPTATIENEFTPTPSNTPETPPTYTNTPGVDPTVTATPEPPLNCAQLKAAAKANPSLLQDPKIRQALAQCPHKPNAPSAGSTDWWNTFTIWFEGWINRLFG